MPLTDLACRKTKPGEKLKKLSDMGGLQLWIFPNGSKLWRYAYRLNGKQRLLAIGRYPDIALPQARMEHAKARDLLRQARDPSHAKKVARIEQQFADDRFEVVAREYLDKLRREGMREATLSKNQWLLDFALPVLGPMSMRSIRPLDVLAVLQTVERRGRYESARRLRSTIGSVFRYGMATARADADPTLALRDALTTPKTKPRAAITNATRLGALLRAIDAFDGSSVIRDGLKLLGLLFPRPGELRLAEWPEFDFEQSVWTIPAERMKMRRPHRVPLPLQACGILRGLRETSGLEQLVLPSLSARDRPLSENTFNASLRRLGYGQDEMTAHGFRATASTLLNESGLWSADAIERQLGHLDEDEVRRAYARGAHWDERVRMMQWWADHLGKLRDPIRLADAVP